MRNRCSTLVTLVVCSTALAGDLQFNYGLGAAAGYDSNPLLVSGDGPGGAYTQLVADGSVRHALSPRLVLFANGIGRVRFHEEAVAGADNRSGSLRAGAGFAPRLWGGRFALAFGAQGALSDSTFIDRATGGVYEVGAAPPADPGTTVEIGDRFDARSWGAFTDLRFAQNRRVRWSLDAVWERTGYSEDYASVGLSPLDYRALTLEPGVELRLSELVTLEASVAWSDLDYDDRPVLDASGAEVAGIAREYHETRWRAALRFIPAAKWSVSLGLGNDAQRDTYAGYYDYGSWRSFLTVERAIGRRTNVQLHGGWREMDYDRAFLPTDPETLRATEVRTWLARFEHGIGEHLRWFADLGTEDDASTDPVFACEQDWFLTGIQFRR
jgi:hypothetical protein